MTEIKIEKEMEEEEGDMEAMAGIGGDGEDNIGIWMILRTRGIGVWPRALISWIFDCMIGFVV